MKQTTSRKPWARVTMVALVAIAVSVFALGSFSSFAIAPQNNEDNEGGWPPSEALTLHPEEISVPVDPGLQETLRRSHRGVSDFLKARPGWKATVDPLSGSIDRAFGKGLDIETVDGFRNARSLGRRFLGRHQALLAPGISTESGLELDEAVSNVETGPVRIIRYNQRSRGLRVLGAGLTLGMRDDRVVLMTTRALSRVTTSTTPTLDINDALDSVAAYAGLNPGSLISRRKPELAFFPTTEQVGVSRRMRHRLVWVLEAKTPEAAPYEWYITYVDAHDGSVHAFFPDARHATTCNADPEQSHATVRGGIKLNAADDPEVVLPIPFAGVAIDGVIQSADLNGRFPFNGGLSTSPLDGPFYKATCDNCSAPASVFATGDESGDINFGTGGGSSGTPTFGNGTSTPADRSAFYHLNELQRLMKKWGNDNFEPVESVVNIQSTCNAFSSSYMLGFYHTSIGCGNTGEIRDVVDHELGHTWDRFDGNGITSGALSEWKGDALAMLMGGDSCIGESFRTGAPGTTPPPTAACDGVRDIDEAATGRTDLPATPAECPTCATVSAASNPCGASVHCNGMIVGQASWHLYNNLLAGTDYITGASFAAGNPAFSAAQARWLMERLLIAGGPPMEVFNPASVGLSVYDAIMLMDDDDANLANGTPHAAYINAAFQHHGVAETPAITDSTNCVAPADPTPTTATVSIDPVTALPQVTIDWTPVGGATNFDVLRNIVSTDAYLPIASDVSAGPIVDKGVEAGMTYNYFVAAVDKAGCAAISPGANILAVSVSEPDLRIASRTITEVAGHSDGDGLLEPGERVSVAVTLEERGGATGATGVTATITGTSSSSPVSDSGPVSFGTIAASGTIAGATSFEVFIGPSESCGGVLSFSLAATGNEGCWLDNFVIPIDGSGSCAGSSSSFVEVDPASVMVTSSGGDADGIADNCETTTVSYDLVNNGSVASGVASATVAPLGTGVTFAPTPSCGVADLGPGASTNCSFTFSLGGATNGGVPFALTADSAANVAPSVLEISVPSESNPPVFSTVSYGFNGTFDGWNGMAWDISAVQTSEGTHSAHSGSTTQNNICGRLTSSEILLDPSTTSTLSLDTFINIEPITDQWYDRANIHIIDVATGQHLEMAPTTGVAYNATGNLQGGLCHISNQNAWGGNLGGFSTSTWDLSSFAGRQIRIEFNYETDEGDDREGIYIDDVSVTNATDVVAPADGQSNTCFLPEISDPVASVPFNVTEGAGSTFDFSWEDLGPGFVYNLYSGTVGTWYDHGLTQLVCSGLGSGVSCDGTTCSYQQTGAGLPAGSLYFVVTGTGFGAEGTSGFSSSPAERDPAQSTCSP